MHCFISYLLRENYAAAAGNAVPVPRLGIATDMVAMTTMCTSLCAVFGGNMTKTAAEAMAIAAIKNTMLKQPIKTMAKEFSKLIVALLESAGWSLAKELERKFG